MFARNSLGTLSDEFAFQMIKDKYSNNYNAYDLFYRFYYHVTHYIMVLVGSG